MDKIIKAQILDDNVALTYIDLTKTVERAKEIHKLSDLSAYALGRTMLVTCFMSAGLKSSEDRLTVSVKSDGNVGTIITTGNSNLELRGIIDNKNLQPFTDNMEISLAKNVSCGKVCVIKSMGLKEPYTGSAKISDGNIIADFRDYFEFSEQLPTEIITFTKGFERGAPYKAIFLQCFPSVEPSYMEQAISTIKESEDSLFLEDAESALMSLFSAKTTVRTPKYWCNCGRKYFSGILKGMGAKELYSIIEEQGQIKINCEFCEKDYIFTKDDVDKLFGI